MADFYYVIDCQLCQVRIFIIKHTHTTDIMKREKNKKDKQKLLTDASVSLELTDRICKIFESCGSPQDPSGSYTGTSIWDDGIPTQDADDL